MSRQRGCKVSKDKPWSDKELSLFSLGLSNEQISEKTGRTLTSVQVRGRRLRQQADVEGSPTTVEQDVAKKSDTYWREQFKALSGKYDTLAKQEAIVDRLVADITALAPRSYNAAPAVAQTRRSSGAEQSGVLMLSDTHVGQVIPANQTLGFGGYNFQTFLERLKFLEQSTVSILKNHTTAKVPELVVPMLGDMIDGALNHGAEAGHLSPLFSQFYFASHALAQFLRALAAHVPVVRCYGVAGNHPRWPNQKRMPTHNRFSNLDTFLFALTAALTRDIKNIRWTLDSQPVAVFDVQGFKCFAMHGDTLRGGDKALGIPVHSIGRQISATTQLYAKHREPIPNYYLAGHMHRAISLPHGNGEVLINGGFPGIDGYALAENFSPCDPLQRLFFVHPIYGKTASYDIKLQHAEPGIATYEMPTGFEIR